MTSDVPLNGIWKKVVFGAGILGTAAVLATSATTLWLAEQWALSGDSERLQRAMQLEPGNADHYFRLGHFYHLDFTRRDLDQAIHFYRRATTIDPRTASYWLALADAYELVGDLEAAGRAYEKAVGSFPVSADAAWARGNFYLRRGELPFAFREFRRALSANPALAHDTFRLCWRATADTELILREAIPANVHTLLGAVNYLLSLDRLPDAARVWNKIVDLGRPLPLPRTFRYFDALVKAGRAQEARSAWDDALRLGTPKHSPRSPGSLNTNGDFEADLLNGGLGWRYQTTAGVSMAYDTTVRNTGSRSLRLSFDGTQDPDFRNLWQYVPVEAGKKYQLVAHIKTQGLTTQNGIRYRIFDPAQRGALDLFTEGLTGTQDWTRLEATFMAGSSSHFVVVALHRDATRQIFDRLEGEVWVDGVDLRPAGNGNIQ